MRSAAISFGVITIVQLLNAAVHAQAVSIRVTDKLAIPRANLGMNVELHGVSFRGDLIRLGGGTTTTDSVGRISFTIPVNRLGERANALQQSKEVRVTLQPEDQYLSAVVIGGLLGTADQKLSVVMKERRVPVYEEILVPVAPSCRHNFYQPLYRYCTPYATLCN